MNESTQITIRWGELMQKFKNVIFANQNFMKTVNKCNDYEDFSPKDSYRFNRFVKKLTSFGVDFEEVWRRERTRKHFNFCKRH
jgi:hypothetical protein